MAFAYRRALGCDVLLLPAWWYHHKISSFAESIGPESRHIVGECRSGGTSGLITRCRPHTMLYRYVIIPPCRQWVCTQRVSDVYVSVISGYVSGAWSGGAPPLSPFVRRRGTSRVREALKVRAAAGVKVPNPLVTRVRVVCCQANIRDIVLSIRPDQSK